MKITYNHISNKQDKLCPKIVLSESQYDDQYLQILGQFPKNHAPYVV